MEEVDRQIIKGSISGGRSSLSPLVCTQTTDFLIAVSILESLVSLFFFFPFYPFFFSACLLLCFINIP